MTKSIFTKEYGRFCALLVKARKKAGLTQVDVADRLGQPQSYVSRYERGERRLDVVEFLEVAKAVEVDPLKFLKELMR